MAIITEDPVSWGTPEATRWYFLTLPFIATSTLVAMCSGPCGAQAATALTGSRAGFGRTFCLGTELASSRSDFEAI